MFHNTICITLVCVDLLCQSLLLLSTTRRRTSPTRRRTCRVLCFLGDPMKLHSSVCTPLALSTAFLGSFISPPQRDAGRSRRWMSRRKSVDVLRVSQVPCRPYDMIIKCFFVFHKLLHLLRFCVVCTCCVMGTSRLI